MSALEAKPAWWWVERQIRARLDERYHPAFTDPVSVPPLLRDKKRFLTLLPDAREIARLQKIVLQGPSRQGKTFLAHHLMWHRMTHLFTDKATREDALDLHFFPTHRLVLARQQHPFGEGEAPHVEEAMDASVLVLDDLGNEPHIDGRFDVIEQIIWRREADGLTTWVTTGLTEDQVRLRYGHAFAARIFEGATVLGL